jgi:protein-disulfide isomerase
VTERTLAALAAALILSIAFVPGAAVQAQKPPPSKPSALESELEALKRQVEQLVAGQEAMRQQLEEIRNLLREPQAPQVRRVASPIGPANVLVEIGAAPMKGASDAKLTIVEFSDFECPFCGRFAREVFTELEREYVAPGRLRYAFRNFPIESLHPHAFKAAVASMCAADQGKYWEMHERLFENQKALDPASLAGHGRELGLNQGEYERCLNGDAHAARVRQDRDDGRRAGASSTPTFFLGFPLPDNPSRIRAVRMIRGAQPFAAFKAEIDKLLQAQ